MRSVSADLAPSQTRLVVNRTKQFEWSMFVAQMQQVKGMKEGEEKQTTYDRNLLARLRNTPSIANLPPPETALFQHSHRPDR